VGPPAAKAVTCDHGERLVSGLAAVTTTTAANRHAKAVITLCTVVRDDSLDNGDSRYRVFQSSIRGSDRIEVGCFLIT
jgi:hypothetical protein